jgi:hypothetical protein
LSKPKSITDFIPNDSFFKKWMDCFPVSESPKSYLLIAAMSALGVALKRGVWMESDMRRTFPMLNIVFIGPSGLGKTEAIGYGQSLLLEKIPSELRPVIIEGEATRAALTDELAKHPHAVFVAEEMASVFTKQKYQEDMIPFVTELLNYKPKVERRTKSGKLQVIVEPSVTFQCGTTLDWFSKQLPNTAAVGGFLPRFLVVHEEEKAQIVPWPDDKLDDERKAALGKHRAEVTRDFIHLVEKYRVHGKMKFKDQEAIDAFSKWVITRKNETGHTAPFGARAREFALRLSMLIAMSRNHEAVDYTDVAAAVGIYEWCMDRIQKVVVPVSDEGEMLNNVLRLFPDGSSTLSERQIMKHLENALRADQVYKYLESLMKSGSLMKTEEGKYKRIFEKKGQ